MRAPASAALAVLLLAAAATPGQAFASTLTVAVDHTVKIPLSGPAGSVVVGNPLVADVTVVDSRSVFVSGRGAGSTDVTVVDPLGRLIFAGDVRVVNEPGAHVVVHRGSDRADLSCDPGCVPSANGATDAGRGSTTTGPAAGAGMVANVLGGAVAGAAMGAASAVAGPGRPS